MEDAAIAELNPSLSLSEAALFLDLDGTLAEFEAAPHAVGPGKQRSALMARACELLGGRLAVLSGRTIAEVDRILDAAAPCVAGMHGLERRRAGGARTTYPAHPSLGEAAAALEAVAKASPGLLLERKPASVALHYRNAPQAEEAVLELATRLSAAHGLALQAGTLVAELKSPGPDKGEALRAFMGEAPFEGARPIFVGDDLTDEAGFAAAASLGGYGVIVGQRRPTAAFARLSDPAAVLQWLEASLDAGGFRLEPQA